MWENIATINELTLSQEYEPSSHQTSWETSQATGISRSPVWHVIKNDLNLRPFKTEVTKNLIEREILRRFKKARRLPRTMASKKVDETWLTDEKIFTVSFPSEFREFSNLGKCSKEIWNPTRRLCIALQDHVGSVMSRCVQSFNKFTFHLLARCCNVLYDQGW